MSAPSTPWHRPVPQVEFSHTYRNGVFVGSNR